MVRSQITRRSPMQYAAVKWCFTLNNPEPQDWEDIISWHDKGVNWHVHYMCVATERAGGRVTGTPHLQGYVRWVKKKRIAALRRLLPRAHWEKSKGDDVDNYEYIKKEEGSPWYEFFETGKMESRLQLAAKGGLGGSEQRKKNKLNWDKALNEAKKGRVQFIQPQLQIQYYNTLNRIANDYTECEPRISLDINLKDRFFWVQGPSGCGKSWGVRNALENFGIPIYTKTQDNKWWDNYNREPVVLFDDFGKGSTKILGNKLKTWIDAFPFKAEVKGGSLDIRPQFIFFTTQYSIEDCFQEMDQEFIEAMTRRLRVIILEHGWRSVQEHSTHTLDIVAKSIHEDEYTVKYRERLLEQNNDVIDMTNGLSDEEEGENLADTESADELELAEARLEESDYPESEDDNESFHWSQQDDVARGADLEF